GWQSEARLVLLVLRHRRSGGPVRDLRAPGWPDERRHESDDGQVAGARIPGLGRREVRGGLWLLGSRPEPAGVCAALLRRLRPGAGLAWVPIDTGPGAG